MKTATGKARFTPYQVLVIFLIAITQFTVVLDFMVMSPLGDILMKAMHLHTSQFGMVVSGYAFSAGIAGILTAGFADRYDRKKLLLFFYVGFIGGTLLCGLATSYYLLVLARIVTGLFAGVIGSVSMAIIADIFAIEQRGRVMGFVQMGFGVSQVLGIPISLYLATKWGWQSPFLLIVGMSALIWIIIALRLQPVTRHLQAKQDKNPLHHLWHTLQRKDYRIGYLSTSLLAIGGFLMMPWGSAFAINNLGISAEQLPLLFMVGGVSTLVIMPLIGAVSDKIDKFRLFTLATLWTLVVVFFYTNLGQTSLLVAMGFNVIMMVGVMGRMVPSTALVSVVPDLPDRGAFMSINSSLQQLAGGIAAALSGMIVVQKTQNSPLEHYDMLGYLVIAIGLLSIWMLARVNKVILPKQQSKTMPAAEVVLPEH